MTPATVELFIRDETDGTVEVTGHGLRVSGTLRQGYVEPGDATAAAHDLLARLLRLGHSLEGALVGAEPDAEGRWHGVLVEVYLGPAAATAPAA
ncbi:MAG: hypothetical protein QM747_14255 [Nocardioides sp.]